MSTHCPTPLQNVLNKFSLCVDSAFLLHHFKISEHLSPTERRCNASRFNLSFVSVFGHFQEFHDNGVTSFTSKQKLLSRKYEFNKNIFSHTSR